MKKIFNKKMLIYFLSFIIPILIIWGYVGVREIISGGTFFKRGQAFLVADMISQYNQLYNYFHNVLAGNDSLKKQREDYYQTYLLPPHGKTVAQNIYDDMRKSLGI